ncbi:hypothetical protein DOY81_007421 [Sarcophaga bullata]|nr:hypothetical protein DOY81_007421 [Sarcophaga bullata]
MSVVIETTIGDLTVDLFTEERPIACLNFMKLCKLKYYNYNLFHTIEQGFIAQTGDPTGAGDGGSSIWGVVEGHHKRFFEAECLPKIHHTTAGLLSLVGAGKHLVGSQFFFTLGENLTSLDGQHCVIGEVVEGHEVLRQLNEAIVDENFRPYQDIRITHTVILEDPFPDPRGFREPSRSPSPSAERLKNGRIAADEDIDDTEGKSMEEIQEMLAEREAKARATILEIVGDLPDAEMAPPENVLFVCKLNPVTTDDDLEIIFSRFGKVKGCEVIRDRKTGDSLQYAFVEFEDQKACEAAYFKMDNVLIDDRRIHVDFSQSVSKVKWRGKGRGIEGDSKGLDFNNLREKNTETQRSYKKNRNFSPTRDRRNREERYRGRSRSRSRGKERLRSVERRAAREERHREQEKQRQRSRSRSRQREMERYSKSERASRDGDKSHAGKHSERYFPVTQRNNRHSDRRYNDRCESERSRYRPTPRRHDETSVDKKETRSNLSTEYNKENASKTSKKHKKQKMKSKKRKHDSSSSEESSESESSESASTSSSSETDSSSEMESKKKKSKRSKQKKSKSKSKKTRKHKK